MRNEILSKLRSFRIALVLALAALFTATTLCAGVPPLLNYQGRVAVNGVNFDGAGSFKFALVDAAGATTYWSNDGTSVAGAEPAAAVSLTVAKGLYSVLLGDTALANMTAVPASVFSNADVRLRVWFNDGALGFQQLTPDQRLAAAGYAMNAINAANAAGVADGAITAAKIANGAVGSAQLGPDLTLGGTTSGTFTGNGAGLTHVPGAVPSQIVAGTSVQAHTNTGYVANDSTRVTVNLPLDASAGDRVQVSGMGAGGWHIEPGPEQQINGYDGYSGEWTARENSRTWWAAASSADGSKLAAVANPGHIYTSTDSGATWTPREDHRAWAGIASSADGNKLVAVAADFGFGGRIYTSTDSGVTWTPRESDRRWSSVASSADGSKLAATVGQDAPGRIYTSTDSGVTWTPRESDRNWRSVASSADGSKLVAVVGSLSGVAGRIYTSSDSGESWIPRESDRVWSSVASSADGSKLVAVVQNGQIYTSTDSGASWTARESDRYWISVASSADGSRLVAAVNAQFFGRIYTSTDSGVTWTPRESGRRWLSVASSADGNKLVALVDLGNIYTFTVGSLEGAQGTTVELQYAGNGLWQPLDAVQSANRPNTAVTRDAGGNFSAGTITATALIGNGTGLTNLAGGNLADGSVTSAKLASNLTLGGTTNGSFAGTFTGNGAALTNLHGGNLTDGTVTSAKLAPDLTLGGTTTGTFAGNGAGLTNVPGAVPSAVVAGTSVQAQANTGYLANDPAEVTVHLPANASVGNRVHVVGIGAGGWRVEAGAGQSLRGAPLTWSARESTRYWSSVASSADGSKLVAAEDYGQIYTSTDGGTTWTPRESERHWTSVASSADGSKLVAVAFSGKIYTSTDSGETWTPRGDVNGAWNHVASSADGSKLVATESYGPIYTSTDSGATWTPRGDNRKWYALASSADGSKLAAAVLNGKIYISTNSGESWAERESNRDWRSVAWSADGSNLFAVAYYSQILKSTDSGLNWTALEYARPWISVASSADGSKLVASSYGYLFASTDSGVHWTEAAQGFRYWGQAAASADGTTLVAAAWSGQVYVSNGRSMAGVQGTTVDLQYAGNGVWQTLDAASSANHPNTTVVRDASGNFTAGTITATTFVGYGGALTGLSGANISDLSITSSKLAVGSVTAEKLGADVGLWSVSGSSVCRASGNVGIGTTTPEDSILDVEGAMHLNDNSIYLRGGNDRNHGVGFSYARNGPALFGWGGGELATTEGGNYQIAMRWDTAGDITVRNNAFKPGGGAWAASSDARLKRDIRKLDGALDSLLKLRSVTFEYKEPEKINELPGRHTGFIAQEVEKVFPEWVGEKQDGYKYVAPTGFESLTVQALRELRAEKDAQIEALQKKNTAMEQKNASLEARLAALEKLIQSPQRTALTKGARK